MKRVLFSSTRDLDELLLAGSSSNDAGVCRVCPLSMEMVVQDPSDFDRNKDARSSGHKQTVSFVIRFMSNP